MSAIGRKHRGTHLTEPGAQPLHTQGETEASGMAGHRAPSVAGIALLSTLHPAT